MPNSPVDLSKRHNQLNLKGMPRGKKQRKPKPQPGPKPVPVAEHLRGQLDIVATLEADTTVIADPPGRPGLVGRRGKFVRSWQPAPLLPVVSVAIVTLAMDDGAEMTLPGWCVCRD